MRFTLRAAVVAAAVAVVASGGAPADATGTTAIADPSGVDYDAACIVNTDLPHPGPDAVASPGTSYCADGSGISVYDGSTESTDIRGVSLASDAAGRFVATCQLERPIVPPGNPTPPAFGGIDTPADAVFSGAGCKVMFQNPARQNNVPTNNVGGGCPRLGTGQVFDQHGHWLDGFHFFIGFQQNWDGTKWIHSVQIGEYNPAPDGGFPFFEVGVNTGTGWVGAGVVVAGSTVTITVTPTILSPDANCVGGTFRTVFARPGDNIVNVKGLSTADVTHTLPVTIPGLMPGVADLTSVGGYMLFSDVTAGNSWNSGIVGGTLQANITGVSYTTGVLERNRGGASASGQPGQVTPDGRSQCCDPFDTLGEGPACPYPTYGGLLPNNPFFNPSVGCHYDDDNVPTPNMGNPVGPWTAINPGERGTLLPEFWDTNFGFVF